MKKKQVNEILANQAKRKTIIANYICFIIILVGLSSFFLYFYLKNNEKYYVTYNETSNIDYQVYLKDNDFFEGDYLDKDNKYIASLIDYIKAEFEYEIKISEPNVDFKYNYRIEGFVEVKEGANSSKYLYRKKVNFLDKQSKTSKGQNIKIKEELDIDYNYYNDLIKSFNNIYGLEDVISTLTINMYIDVTGSSEKFEDNNQNTSVTTLVIPLTTRTVGLDMKDNLVNKDSNIVIENEDNTIIVFLILGIVLGLIAIFLIYKLCKYISLTRSAESIYEIELKKILNNYHSYIQKVSNKMDLKEKLGFDDCLFYKVEEFTDMLEIRDSINSPIIMFENESKTTTSFMILDVANRAIYVYNIKITDIKKEMKSKTKAEKK